MKKLLEIPLSILLVLGIAAASTGQGFTYSTLCGDDRPDCAYFFDDEAVLNELQGLIQENITVTNEGNITDTYIQYETALGLDCTGIISVQEKIDDGEWFEITNDAMYGAGEKENCIINLPIYLNESVSKIYFSIVMENFPKWEIQRAKDIVNEMNNTLTTICEQVGQDNGMDFYATPITIQISESFNGLSDDVVYCYRVMDDLYYFYENYQESQEITAIGDYESYLSEIRYYLDAINIHMGFLQKSMTLQAQESILDKLGITGGMKVFGTEYQPGDAVKTFLQITDPKYVNASCTVNIYYPNNSIYVSNGLMVRGLDNLYYYDLVAPNITGVFMVTAGCTGYSGAYYVYDSDSLLEANVTITNGAIRGGTSLVLNSRTDSLWMDYKAATNPMTLQYEWNSSDLLNMTSLYLLFLGQSGTAGLVITPSYWNWSSSNWVSLPTYSTVYAQGTVSPIGDGDEYFSRTLNPTFAVSSNGMVRIKLSVASTTAAVFINWLTLYGAKSTVSQMQDTIKGGNEIHITNTQAQALSLMQTMWTWLTTTLWAKLLSMETQVQETKSLTNMTLWYANNTYLLFNQYDLTSRQINSTLNQMKALLDQPKLLIHGTEYQIGQVAKVWLQLLDSVGNSVDNGLCYTDIYTPEGGTYIENAQMTNMMHDGMYYYDLFVPDTEGVYPAIAKCYYGATTISHYPTNYFTTKGSYSSGTLADLYTINSAYMRFQEATISGVRRLDIGFNFTNMSSCASIPEVLMTGITVGIDSSFNSVINDDLTLWIYNFTGSNWIPLSNKVLSQGVFSVVSNTLLTDNITKSGFYSVTKGIQIKINDTTLPDTSNTNYDIDQLYISCNQLSNSTWQEVKGSSEIHVNPTINTLGISNDFFLFTLCGSEELQSLSSACEEFQFGTHTGFYDDFSEPQGWLYEDITVINARQRDFTNSFDYETPMGVDCTSFLDITKTDEDNITTDYWNEVSYRAGSKDDNCRITIPITMFANQTRFQIRLYMDNYMLWEVNRDKRYIDLYREEPEAYCEEFRQMSGINMTVPIQINLSEYSSQTLLLVCWQILDDLYWLDYFVGTIPDRTTSGDFESVLSEIRFYYPEIVQQFNAVIDIENSRFSLFDTWTLCEKQNGVDLRTDDFTCQKIMPPSSYFSSQEGWLLANLTFVNKYSSVLNTFFQFETAKDVDCTAILDIIRVDTNGTETNINSQVARHGGSVKNCQLDIPIEFTFEQAQYDVLIKQQNYITWNIQQMRDKVLAIRNNSQDVCNYVFTTYNMSYYLPINSSLDDYPNAIQFCWRTLDDLYWWDYFWDGHMADNHYLYELLGYYDEFLYFYPFIMESNAYINDYQGKDMQATTLALIQQIPSNVWTFTGGRNLTYYPDVNNTEIAQAVTDAMVSFSFSGGTEYYPGGKGMLVTQFFRGSNPLDNKSVSVKVFYPDMSTYLVSTPMMFKEDGIYYYNFTVPSTLGVYTASAKVTDGGQTYYASHTFHVNKGLKALMVK